MTSSASGSASDRTGGGGGGISVLSSLHPSFPSTASHTPRREMSTPTSPLGAMTPGRKLVVATAEGAIDTSFAPGSARSNEEKQPSSVSSSPRGTLPPAMSIPPSTDSTSRRIQPVVAVSTIPSAAEVHLVEDPSSLPASTPTIVEPAFHQDGEPDDSSLDLDALMRHPPPVDSPQSTGPPTPQQMGEDSASSRAQQAVAPGDLPAGVAHELSMSNADSAAHAREDSFTSASPGQAPSVRASTTVSTSGPSAAVAEASLEAASTGATPGLQEQ
jgi:hypothetical protein